MPYTLHSSLCLQRNNHVSLDGDSAPLPWYDAFPQTDVFFGNGSILCWAHPHSQQVSPLIHILMILHGQEASEHQQLLLQTQPLPKRSRHLFLSFGSLEPLWHVLKTPKHSSKLASMVFLAPQVILEGLQSSPFEV